MITKVMNKNLNSDSNEALLFLTEQINYDPSFPLQKEMLVVARTLPYMACTEN